MPDRPNPEPKPAADIQTTRTNPLQGASDAPLTVDQLRRWAPMIADGQDQFPENLQPEDREKLLKEVRHLLRERLLNLVARAIANHIVRQRGQ